MQLGRKPRNGKGRVSHQKKGRAYSGHGRYRAVGSCGMGKGGIFTGRREGPIGGISDAARPGVQRDGKGRAHRNPRKPGHRIAAFSECGCLGIIAAGGE